MILGLDKKYFTVDPKSGVVRVAQSLPIGTYNLQAIARIPSGAEDFTRVRLLMGQYFNANVKLMLK